MWTQSSWSLRWSGQLHTDLPIGFVIKRKKEGKKRERKKRGIEGRLATVIVIDASYAVQQQSR